jgi:hypothetical protein
MFLPFQALNAQTVYVIGENGNLWYTPGPFGQVPNPHRLWVDGKVAAFLPSQLRFSSGAYVLGTDGNLRDTPAPFGQVPNQHRAQVDGNVAAFLNDTALDRVEDVVFVVVLRVLADRPETASWLSPREKETLNAMLARERRERPKTSLVAALADTRVIILAAVQFGFTLGSYGIAIVLPQIIKGFGLSNLASSVLAAVPYIFASAGMLWWSWHVERYPK